MFELSEVMKTFQLPRNRLFGKVPTVTAVDNVSLTISEGESVAIVGESGSGKTTLLRLLLALTNATSGTVSYRGRPVSHRGKAVTEVRRQLRRETGLVFQDPHSTLNPRRTIGQSVAEPLEAHSIRGDHDAMVRDILGRMDLPADAAGRYPRSFSGGERQRVALARALVHSPKVLLGDEPVSALDVLVRGKLIDLLSQLRAEMGLTLVTVTHDLAVVPKLADRVLVMTRGALVEDGSVEQVFTDPQHPYTKSLISAMPKLGQPRSTPEGVTPQ